MGPLRFALGDWPYGMFWQLDVLPRVLEARHPKHTAANRVRWPSLVGLLTMSVLRNPGFFWRALDPIPKWPSILAAECR